MMKHVLRALAAAFSIAVASSDAAVVAITPISQSALVGDQVSIGVTISGLVAGGAPSLGTFDLNLGFDGLRLTYQSTVFGTGLDVFGLGSIQSVTPGAGTVNLLEVSLDSIADLNDMQADSFLLATVTFHAQAVGDAAFSMTASAFGDAEGNALDIGFGDLTSVTVLGKPGGAIPEPASYTLVALALLCAWRANRRGS